MRMPQEHAKFFFNRSLARIKCQLAIPHVTIVNEKGISDKIIADIQFK